MFGYPIDPSFNKYSQQTKKIAPCFIIVQLETVVLYINCFLSDALHLYVNRDHKLSKINGYNHWKGKYINSEMKDEFIELAPLRRVLQLQILDKEDDNI